MRKISTAAASLVLLTFATVCQAQVWKGDETVGVEVLDKRKPLANAEVLLRYADVEPYVGPAAELTDSKGKVLFTDIGLGRWRIDVRRDGYAHFFALIEVRPGKPPIITAGPLREGTEATLKFKFFKTGSNIRRAEGRKASKKRPQETPQAIPQPEATRPRARQPQTAPPQVAPPAVPTPAPSQPPARPPAKAPTKAPEAVPVKPETKPKLPPAQPAPEAKLEPKPEPKRVPASEPQREESAPATAPPAATQGAPTPAKIQPPAPKPAAPTPTPAPQPSMAEPAPSEAAPWDSADARATLRPTAVLRSGNSCPECPPGEQALVVEQLAAPAASGGGARGSGCGGAEAALANIVALAGGRAGLAEENWAGPLIDPTTGAATLNIRSEARQRVTSLLAEFADPESSCQVLTVFLPVGSSYRGYRYEARHERDQVGCNAGQECPTGGAIWPGHPKVRKTPTGIVVYAHFDNRSARAQVGRLVVFFEPAPAGRQ